MIGFLSRPVFFLVAGIGVLLAGAYVLARGASGRRRFSFVQVSLSVGLWVILYGILLQPGADPAADRTWAELFVFFSLLTATTLYQFVTYGLGFGRRSRAPGERRLGIWLLWGACAAVGLLMLFGGLEMVSSVGAPPADSLLVLRWQAIPVVAAAWTGILGAVLITLRTARRSSVIERSSLAAWVIGGLGAFCVVPLVLHSSLFGAWGTGLAGVSALAGTVILARAARLGPVGAEALPPLAKTVLGGLEGPAVVLARDGSIEAVNPAFRETFEFGRRRLVGKNVTEVVEEVGGASLALSSLSLDVKEEGQEVRLRGPDGRWTSARATACRLGHVEGEALPVFLLFTPESMDRRAVARSNP
ncbi:MAG TPA: PAS domain-containing protein, partial [Longimicrobiales bacterium]|nr:PAS domain-containing protein [Longimicrobiales bacterium]